MQVAEFVRVEAVIGADVGQNFARLQPILARRSEDWMTPRQSA
jgi:hypothetical protein